MKRMLRRARSRGVALAVAAAAAAALGAACSSTGSAHYGRGAAVELVATHARSEADVAALERDWNTALRGLASDPQSVALLQRLFSGAPLVVEAAPSPEQDVVTEAPPAGAPLVLRVAEVGVPLVEPRGPWLALHRDVAYGWVSEPGTEVELEVLEGKGEDAARAATIDALAGAPTLELVRLAIEDYAQRRLEGWVVSRRGAPSPPASRAAARADLDRRIAAYLTHYRWHLRR